MAYSKKAQIWYTDFMIGILIFFVVIFLYYEYAYSINQDPSEIVSDLMLDAKSISSSLVTKGSPVNWTKSNVEVIGITDGNQRIVQEKLDMFVNITYGQVKTKLRTAHDFYFYLEDLNGTTILLDSGEGYGSPVLNETDNVISMTRVVIYDSRLVNMVVQVWQG